MTAADLVGFHHEIHGRSKLLAVQRDGHAFFESDRHRFRFDLHGLIPERHAHDGFDDLHRLIEVFQILRFVRRTQHVAVGGISLFRLHAVGKAFGVEEFTHFLAAAQFLNELHVKPRLVNLEVGVHKQTVTVEAFDVVALVGGTIAPDVDAVVAHRRNEHRPRHCTADRRGVEVGNAGRRNVEGTGLNGSNAFGHQLRAAVDQTGVFGTVLHRAVRNRFVIVLIGLTQVSRIGIRQSTLVLHPAQSCRGIQTTGERDTDLFADGNALQNRLRHCLHS